MVTMELDAKDKRNEVIQFTVYRRNDLITKNVCIIWLYGSQYNSTEVLLITTLNEIEKIHLMTALPNRELHSGLYLLQSI